MTTANKITVVRILMIPAFVTMAIYYGESVKRGQPLEWQRFAAIAIFILAAVSDGLDGYVARHYIASSRSRGRGRVAAEQFVVAHVRLEPERKRIAQPRNYPDQLVDQDIHCHAREQNFRNTASRCVNKRDCRNYCGGCVADFGKQTDNWVQAKAEFCPWNAQEIIHDECKPSETRFKRGTCPLAAGSVFRS